MPSSSAEDHAFTWSSLNNGSGYAHGMDTGEARKDQRLQEFDEWWDKLHILNKKRLWEYEEIFDWGRPTMRWQNPQYFTSLKNGSGYAPGTDTGEVKKDQRLQEFKLPRSKLNREMVCETGRNSSPAELRPNKKHEKNLTKCSSLDRIRPNKNEEDYGSLDLLRPIKIRSSPAELRPNM